MENDAIGNSSSEAILETRVEIEYSEVTELFQKFSEIGLKTIKRRLEKWQFLD